ncbi:unnamed protein product [Orchesella dallaii]|uniref:G-protein coupled receptors family 3 profile domain-containing protein n=1 Tax=Orchesella dallaii TaxID=48710 RepID=A0ABP1QSE2_9HEXA
MMGNHCMGQRNNYYMLTGVKLSTEFVNVIMEKVDMIVSFLYKIKSIERHASMKGGQEDFWDVYTYALRTIEGLKDDFPLRDVRLLIHETDEANPPKPPRSGGINAAKKGHYGTVVYMLENDMKLTPRHLSNIEELRREPWFYHPYYTPPPTSSSPSSEEGAKNFFKVGHLPISSQVGSRSKYHRNKMMDAQMFGDSYFTWPYFDCRAYRQQEQQQQQLRSSKSNYYHHQRRDLYFTHEEEGQQKNPQELVRRGSTGSGNNGPNSHFHHNGNNNENNYVNQTHTWLASYTAWFPIGGLKENKSFGELVVDMDLSQYDINQCGFADEGEKESEQAFANPLYYFRDTHKCDRINFPPTSKCHFLPGKGWRLGSYECRCAANTYAYLKTLKNVIAGYSAEAAWDTWVENKTNGNDSVLYPVIVACKNCPMGCDNCDEGISCLASISWIFRLVLLCVSVFCSVGSIALVFVTYKFRKIPVLKSSSPIFHCITLFGCMIMYSEMIALFPILTRPSCIAVKWTRHLGFSITYTALYMKLCRVYLTFRVKSAHKIKLTEKHLLHWMSPIMVIMLLYLFAWTISDPPDTMDMLTTDDKKFVQCVYNWWDHALAIGEVIFLAYGVWICWRIRENPDAQYISYAIYNIAFTNLLMVMVHLLILPQAGPDMKYLFAFIRTQLSTTVTIGFVFGSKLWSVLKGDNAALKEISNSANGFGHETLDLAEENQQLKEELTKMATQIEKLKSYAMCKNNPHLKNATTTNITTDPDFSKLDSFTQL